MARSKLFIFCTLAAVHLIAAGWCPILDCDEVFNYWEPLHFLVHGQGLQTWEYARPYALRSYLYLLLHAPVVLLAKIGGFSKVAQFYSLRAAIAVGTAACEAHWLEAIGQKLGATLQGWTLFLLALSPGMFIASAAFIPSSFAMACLLLCQSFQLRSTGNNDEASLAASDVTEAEKQRALQRSGFFAVLAGACAVVAGWPFCVVALLPAGLDLAWRFGLPRCVGWGVVALVFTATPTLLVDTYFYGGGGDGGFAGQVVFSTWNLVAYNMFPSGTGSELYGVEPWHFYVKNLSLNFGPALPLALAAQPLLALLATTHTLVAHRSSRSSSNSSSSSSIQKSVASARLKCLHAMCWTAPFSLWLAFMSVLPHKEERFMFPVYPQLCLAASAALTLLQTAVVPNHAQPTPLKSSPLNTAAPVPLAAVFGSFWPSTPAKPALATTLKAGATLAFAVLFAAVSVGRTAAVVSHYHAPLSVYSWLSDHINHATPNATAHPTLDSAPDASPSLSAPASAELVVVCVGKEWYRFSSHFLLDSPSARLSFVDGGFRGQLPRHFDSTLGTRGPAPGNGDVAYPFNDVNAEQRDRYVNAERDCDFVVDLGLHSSSDGGGGGGEASSFSLEPWGEHRSEANSSARSHQAGGGEEAGAQCKESQHSGVPGTCSSSVQWELLHSEPFLDASRTSALARIFLLPESLLSQFTPRDMVVPKRALVPYEVWRNNKK